MIHLVVHTIHSIEMENGRNVVLPSTETSDFKIFRIVASIASPYLQKKSKLDLRQFSRSLSVSFTGHVMSMSEWTGSEKQ